MSSAPFTATSYVGIIEGATIISPILEGNWEWDATGGYLQFSDIAAPANPAAGQGRLYKKTGDDGIFWLPDAAGPEVDLTTGAAATLSAVLASGNITGGTDIVMSGAADTLNFTRTNNLILDAATIATADRTVTLPDPGGPDSVVYLALAQTLTNKTVTAPTMTGNWEWDATGGYLQFSDVAAPANPSAGEGRLYKKTGDDGIFWLPDAAGPEVDLTAGVASALSAVLTVGNTTGGSDIVMSGAGDTLNFTRTNNLILDAATIATADRTVTFPDPGGPDSVVYLALAQTLTNKTLTAPTLNAVPTLSLDDTDSAFNLVIESTSTITTADKTLTLDVNDADRTVSLGGNLTTSGNFSLTLTQTGATNVTLPTTGTLATLAGTETFTNKTITSPIVNQITTDGTEELLIFVDGGTAVNEFTMTNAATANNPELSATGGDANVGIDFLTKGTGVFNFAAGGATTSAELRLQDNTGGQYIAITVPAAVTTRTHTIPDVVDDTFVMVAATQTLTNKTLTAPTLNAVPTFSLDDTDSAFNLVIESTSTITTADKTLTLDVNDADRTVSLGGNLTTANAFVTSGNFSLTLTQTGATNVTLPTTGTLATLAGTETFTNKTITSPIVNQITTDGTEEVLIFADAGTAVNEFTMTNAATANNPELSATGGDANVGIDFLTKGTGVFSFAAGGATTSAELRLEDNTGGQYIAVTVPATVTNRTHTIPDVADDTFVMVAATQTLTNKTLTSPIVNEVLDSNSNEVVIFGVTASAVNEVTVTNAATAGTPTINATGDDANVDLSLNPKAAGNLQLDGLTWPNADGTADQVLQTDGAGTLSFTTAVILTENTTTTTNATPTTIETIATSSDTTYLLDTLVVARRTDSGTESAGYVGNGTWRNNAGTVTAVGVPALISMEDVAAWNIGLTISGTNLLVQVVGAVGSTINWKSQTRLVTV